MNADLTEEAIRERLKGYRNIVVCGPQRSGTTFAGFAISRMLDISYYTEEAFGIHDEGMFFQLLQTTNRKVIQCPALSHLLDKIQDKADTIVVWMQRPVADIMASQKRIDWDEEGTEKAKYIKRIHELDRKDVPAEIHFGLPIAEIKYLFWEKFQRANLPHTLEIRYADLSTIFPDLWIENQNRNRFGARQINQPNDMSFISDSTYICQLFLDYGDGFSEAFSFLGAFQEGENLLSFDLPATQDEQQLTALRFDPANMPIVIDIRSIAFLPNTVPLEIASQNSQLRDRNCFYFNHNDPQIIITPAEKETVTGKQLILAFEVVAVGLNAVQKLHKDYADKPHLTKEESAAEQDISWAEQVAAYKAAHEAALGVIAEKEALQKKLETHISSIRLDLEEELLYTRKQLEAEKDRLEAKNESLEHELRQMQKAFNHLNTEQQAELQAKEIEHSELLAALKATGREWKNLQKAYAAHREKTANIVAALEAEKEVLAQEVHTWQKALAEQHEGIAASEAALKDQLAQLQSRYTAIEKQLQEKDSTIHHLHQQLQNNQQERSQLDTHKQALAEENAALRNSLSFKLGWLLTGPFRWMYETFNLKKIKFWFHLAGIAISKPFSVISKIRMEHFGILRKAIREESPGQIIGNFRRLLTGEPPVFDAKATPSLPPPKPDPLPAASLPAQVQPAMPSAPVPSGVIEEMVRFQNRSADYAPQLQKELKIGRDPKLKLIAFYLPQFHAIPENDKFWGKGFTEWTNVTKGIPRFASHYQPRLPADLGFYNLSRKETIARQIELAKKAGLFGFCFHYYWFSGKRLLEKPLDLFLEDSSLDFNFCICWANENWTKRWDGLDQEVIIKQDHLPDDVHNFIEDLKPVLQDKRYIHLDGRPLIIVYRPQLIPNIKEAVDIWRQNLMEDGFANPIFCAVQGFGLYDPAEVGFDAVVEFPPHKLAEHKENRRGEYQIYDKNYQGIIIHYEDVMNTALAETQHPYPLFRGVFPSWDNEARKKGKGTTYHGSTPEKFEKWLQFASRYALDHPVNDQSLVFINAWNEWAEGAYLEPDQHYGYRYLNSVQSVSEHFNCHKRKYIVVSHDAHKHGAQLNVLALAKTLKQQFGAEITILLLDGGALEPAFAAVAPTINIQPLLHDDRSKLLQLFRKLAGEGFTSALINTTVSNNILPELKKAGIKCVSLIHELPSLIKEYGLEQEVWHVAEKADHVIFASQIVKNGFLSLRAKFKGEVIIKPQGVYAFDLFSIDRIKSGQLRKRLGLTTSDVIIANLGFADLRKGIDLFVRIADEVAGKNPHCHFVWIGNIHGTIEPWIQHDIDRLSRKENVHLLPFHDNISEYIKDIDIFALTSREDPFPSVVLECLAMETPCVVFEKSGGIVELNDHYPDLLTLVPYLDTEAMSKAILRLAEHPEERAKKGAFGRKIMQQDFSYDEYSFFLTHKLDPDLQKVSVIVPNYNYAHTLEERLQSIWAQDYPIFELIVLDDCSTDNSLEQIEALARKYDRNLRLVENERNTGSAFLQWQKGVNIARGDLIWIAEADDIAEPGFLSKMTNFFKDPELSMAYCQSKQIDESGRFLASDYLYYTDDLNKFKWREDYVADGRQEIIEGLAVKNTILNVSSVVWRLDFLRELINEHIEEVRKFKVAGDWFLYVKALERAKMGFCADALNVHRRHSSSVTHRLKAERHLEEIRMVQEMIGSYHFFPEHLTEIQRSYLEGVKEHLFAKE